MLDAILLVSTSAVFIFGYFLMKKLDVFLDADGKKARPAPAYGENSLRIGLSDPFMAESISGILEAYGKQHPEASVYLFSGAEGELRRDLEAHKLDMIFLPERTALPEKTGYHAQKVLLCFTPVLMKHAGLSIEPITQDQIVQKAVWRDHDHSSVMDSFIELLNGAAVNLPQK